MNLETISLIVTIIGAAIGGTWVISTHLGQIQVAIASIVERVKQHDADIIDLKKRRNARSR